MALALRCDTVLWAAIVLRPSLFGSTLLGLRTRGFGSTLLRLGTSGFRILSPRCRGTLSGYVTTADLAALLSSAPFLRA